MVGIRNNEEKGSLNWSTQYAGMFFLEFSLALHFARKQTFTLLSLKRAAPLRGWHHKYCYTCTVAASHFITSHIWFSDVFRKNDEEGETKVKMWKWRSESHMAANLELHVATSAARYPRVTNYLSILTTKLKSRGTTEREREGRVATREKRCWIQCYKTK
jgi:inorganic triphosphatase YgiF